MEGNLFRVIFDKLLDALRIRNVPSALPRTDLAAERVIQPFSVVSDWLAIRGRIFFPVARPSRLYPCLIMCHGIPGAGQARPADDPGYDGLAADFTALGVAVAFFNFRGCGESEGNFEMLGWARDLESVLDKVLNTPYIDPTRVLVLGFSGGGAAAIRVAAENRRIYSLAVVGTPAHFGIFEKDQDEVISDFRDRGIIRDSDFPPDEGRWMHSFEEIEPRRWAAHFKGTHLLVVHGDADELVPVEHAHEIFRAAPAGIAEESIISGGVHRLRLDPRCIQALQDWVLRTLGWKS